MVERSQKPDIPMQKFRPTPAFYAAAGQISDVAHKRCKQIIDSEEGGIGVPLEGEKKDVNITVLDLFLIPDGIDILDFLKQRLNVKDFSSSEVLERLNQSLQHAKNYLVECLHISLPAEINKISQIKTKDDIIKFFGPISRREKGGTIGLAPFYCALAKTTLAFWEFEGGQFQNLVHQTKYLYDALQKPAASRIEVEDPDEMNRLHILKSFGPRDGKEGEGKDDVTIYIGKNNHRIVNAYSIYRGKTAERTITKMIAKPEFNLQEAIRDGIGIRFEVDSRADAVALICFLKEYLFHSSLEVYLRDNQFVSKLSEGEKGRARERFAAVRLSFNEQKNPASTEEYESINICGDINVPSDPSIPDSMMRPVSVEIQIVLKGNKNEEGYNGHEIYEARQKLQACSRLFGVFSEEYLDLICKEASERTGGKLTEEGIKKDILEKQYITAIKVRSERKQKNKYCWTSHLDRWEQTGMLPGTISIPEQEKKRKEAERNARSD